MKLIYKKYLKFYNYKLFYLNKENLLIDKVLNIKGGVKHGTLERDNKHCGE